MLFWGKNLKEEKYECKNCGKIVRVSNGKHPSCCDKPMEKLPLLGLHMQNTHGRWKMKMHMMMDVQENRKSIR